MMEHLAPPISYIVLPYNEFIVSYLRKEKKHLVMMEDNKLNDIENKIQVPSKFILTPWV